MAEGGSWWVTVRWWREGETRRKLLHQLWTAVAHNTQGKLRELAYVGRVCMCAFCVFLCGSGQLDKVCPPAVSHGGTWARSRAKLMVYSTRSLTEQSCWNIFAFSRQALGQTSQGCVSESSSPPPVSPVTGPCQSWLSSVLRGPSWPLGQPPEKPESLEGPIRWDRSPEAAAIPMTPVTPIWRI